MTEKPDRNNFFCNYTSQTNFFRIPHKRITKYIFSIPYLKWNKVCIIVVIVYWLQNNLKVFNFISKKSKLCHIRKSTETINKVEEISTNQEMIFLSKFLSFVNIFQNLSDLDLNGTLHLKWKKCLNWIINQHFRMRYHQLYYTILI